MVVLQHCWHACARCFSGRRAEPSAAGELASDRVEVDETPSIDQGCQLLDHTSPGLVVLDAAVPGSAAARERLARKAARRGAPVLALATATDPVAYADLTLFPDINPHDILGAVSSLAANLYHAMSDAIRWPLHFKMSRVRERADS